MESQPTSVRAVHPGSVPIDGVVWRPLNRYDDARGWLCELFRRDELPEALCPAMAYASVTAPGTSRGPHEHAFQSDVFCFFGPSTFEVRLWDNRPESATYGARQVHFVGRDQPALLVIPPGVVHGYRNVGGEPGLVLNWPDRLYKGWGRSEPVDEVRHEDDPDSPFGWD